MQARAGIIHRISIVVLLSFLALPGMATAQNSKQEKSATPLTSFHFNVEKEPSWVRRIDVPSQLSPVEGAPPFRMLLRDDQRRYSGKEVVSYYHRALAVIQKSALDKVSQVEIEFNPDYQTLSLHELVVVRAGVRINKLDRSKVKLIQREKDLEKKMYNGVVSASLVMDDIRVGDVMEFSYTIKGGNPLFADKIDTGFGLSGWDVPVEQLSIRLLTPSSRKLSVKVHGISLEPMVSEINGEREMIWSRSHIAAMADEEEYPAWYEPSAWLEISEYENWAQVIDWAKPLYRVPDDLSPDLLAQIAQMRTTSQNTEEAALRALNFVQQEIRYFGVEIGISSHRPTHPNQVFKQRYGDCKDKTLLLATIFNRLGIKAYPALVSSRDHRGIGELLPSPRAFDHVITMAQIGGATWWIDATNNFQAGDFERRGYGDFERALVVGDGSYGLTVMNVPDNSERRIDEVFTVADFDQPVKLVVTEKSRGAAANYYRYLNDDYGSERMAEFRLNQYAKIFPGLRRSGQPEMTDDHKSNEYTTMDTYVVDGMFERGSNRWSLSMPNLSLREYLDSPKVVKRKTPLGLNRYNHVRYSAKLVFDKLNVNLSNDSRLVSNDYLQYFYSISRQGKQILVHQDLDFLGDYVPVSGVAGYLDTATQIRNLLGFHLSFPDRSSVVWSDNSSTQALLHAAVIGDVAALEQHLAKGVSANSRGVSDFTPLLLAVTESRLAAVQFLLKNGAKANVRSKENWSPLLMATLYGSEEVVGELLKAGADIKYTRNGQTALMLAAERGHAGLVRVLLAQGAEVDQANAEHYNFTALMYAAINGQAAAVQALLDGKANLKLKDVKEYTPFQLAAERGDWNTAEILLKAGADPKDIPSARGHSAMSLLARSNRIEAVEAGIKYGLEMSAPDSNGFTPLMNALKNGNYRIANLLKNQGAFYREVGKEGWTPLMSAIEHQDIALSQKLLAAEADVRATDKYGISALTIASAFGLTEIADAMIQKGADVNLVDKGWSETPLMYAVENGSKKMVELLVSKGADLNRKDVDGNSILARTYPMEKSDLYDVLIAAGAKREFVHPAQKNLVVR